MYITLRSDQGATLVCIGGPKKASVVNFFLNWPEHGPKFCVEILVDVNILKPPRFCH